MDFPENRSFLLKKENRKVNAILPLESRTTPAEMKQKKLYYEVFVLSKSRYNNYDLPCLFYFSYVAIASPN